MIVLEMALRLKAWLSASQRSQRKDLRLPAARFRFVNTFAPPLIFNFSKGIPRCCTSTEDVVQEGMKLYRSNKDEVCSEAGKWYTVRVDKSVSVVVGMARIQYYERRRRFDKRVTTMRDSTT